MKKPTMLPLVINSDPYRLIQITMAGSVGTAGTNAPVDARFVQTLLNLVPEAKGGPVGKLKVDGLVGPKTTAAIQRFQRANSKACDGRIDVHGPTIKALAQYVHSNRLMPSGLPNVSAPHPDIVRGLSGSGTRNTLPSSPSPSAFTQLPQLQPLTNRPQYSNGGYNSDYLGPMGWKIVTSSSVDASVLVASVTSVNLHMTHDIEPGLNYVFHFFGPGVGLSAAPLGFDESTTAMPSYGTNLHRYSFRAKLPQIYAHELVREACIISVGGNGQNGLGWSGTAIFIGSVVPFPGIAHYVAALNGRQTGSLNGGITFYAGAITSFL